MQSLLWRIIVGFCLPLAVVAAPSESEPNVDLLLNQAQAAHQKGEHKEGIALATKAIAAAPKNPHAYWVRARIHAHLKNHEEAIADSTRGLEIESRAPQAYQLRGSEFLKLGQFQKAIADFDTAVRFVPAQEAYQWQRGIAYYYAGRFEEGRKQFELHQTVNSNDVENAVWHFLCLSRLAGVEQARASLLPIKNDARIPMMKVYEVFAGKAKPEDVLGRAQASYSSKDQLAEQMFFAHFYLGLYYEANKQPKLAREHIEKAAAEFRRDHYMGDVARVHAKLLQSR